MGRVTNDDSADWSEAWKLFPGDVAYVWHGGLRSVEQATSLEGAGFAIRSQIIWNKGRLVISRGDYHWQHEACWYAVRKGKKVTGPGAERKRPFGISRSRSRPRPGMGRKSPSSA
jgi:hypothetical protein